MDVTTTPSITSLINNLRKDFPQFQFVKDTEFRWSPQEKTIFYDISSGDLAALLHELSHAVLEHMDYQKDMQLIELERDAWEYARRILAPAYNTTIGESAAQDSLDTYRDWMHARSTCPHCHAVGIQTKKQSYSCLACHTNWRVNDARICALRRYITTS